MAFQQPTNRGALFKNRDKETETASDWIGEINVDGVVYFIDGWVNDGANGKYLKLRIKRKDKQPTETNHLNDDFDDDIPL